MWLGLECHLTPISTHDWVSSLMTRAINPSPGRPVIGRERRTGRGVLTHLSSSRFYLSSQQFLTLLVFYSPLFLCEEAVVLAHRFSNLLLLYF